MKSWGSQPQGFFQILLQDSFQLEASAEDPSGIYQDRFSPPSLIYYYYAFPLSILMTWYTRRN